MTILIAEDEPAIRDYLGVALSAEGYGVEFAHDGEEVLTRLKSSRCDVSLVLLDLVMPRKDGFETLRGVHCSWPALPVIALSGSCTRADVATVLKGGAVDFLSKPIDREDLIKAVEAALAKASSGNTLDRLGDVNGLVPGGTWVQTCEALLKRVGASDVPVLLRGETGVGKEVLARRLHAHSKRATHPFLKLNCAALPSELVESELFGYERGAFTGAYKNTPGKFEMANQGTILLDEIGDMDFRLEAKLLQVLQDREFLRLGAKETLSVDVRVMAATHCDLEKAIEQGRFREDLYYRLNIIEIQVPPVRERKDEIVGLAESFFLKYAPTESVEMTPLLKEALLEYDWPGNVRELENVIRKFLVIRSVDLVAAELRRKTRRVALSSALPISRTLASGYGDWRSPLNPAGVGAGAPAEPARTQPTRSPLAAGSNGQIPIPAISNMPDGDRATVIKAADCGRSSVLADLDDSRKKAERDAIVDALAATLWNRKRAAALLRVDYKALLYKMKKLGIGEDVQTL